MHSTLRQFLAESKAHIPQPNPFGVKHENAGILLERTIGIFLIFHGFQGGKRARLLRASQSNITAYLLVITLTLVCFYRKCSFFGASQFMPNLFI